MLPATTDSQSNARKKKALENSFSSRLQPQLLRRKMEAEANTTGYVLEVSVDGGGGGGGETKAAAGELTSSGNVDRKASTHPPDDDCCPICFGEFSVTAVACKANCGHWYCGSCILQLWNYSAASGPCKCPMCSSRITNLTPEASFFDQQDLEAREVLQSVQRYNRLYVGGVRGLAQNVVELPLLLKRLVIRMMDPDRRVPMCVDENLLTLTFLIIYDFSPFDFISLNREEAYRLCRFVALAIVVILRLAGLYRRRRLNQRVRAQMAAEALPV
ncbi:E3 ubiquitin-protein ligase RNF170 [Linum grandiflorum]